MRVLMIGNDRILAGVMSDLLKKRGFLSDSVGFDGEVTDYLHTGVYDLIVMVSAGVLDLAGDLIRFLRRSGVTLPLLLLSVRRETSDVVSGLEAGADDYLRLPFDGEEFIARIKALLRRPRSWVGENEKIGNTSLDFFGRLLSAEDRTVSLTEKEAEIAFLLFSSPSQIVPKEKISGSVWGLGAESEYNHVEVYISFLRRKLAQIGSTLKITAVRGAGYRLSEGEPG